MNILLPPLSLSLSLSLCLSLSLSAFKGAGCLNVQYSIIWHIFGSIEPLYLYVTISLDASYLGANTSAPVLLYLMTASSYMIYIFLNEHIIKSSNVNTKKQTKTNNHSIIWEKHRNKRINIYLKQLLDLFHVHQTVKFYLYRVFIYQCHIYQAFLIERKSLTPSTKINI